MYDTCSKRNGLFTASDQTHTFMLIPKNENSSIRKRVNIVECNIQVCWFIQGFDSRWAKNKTINQAIGFASKNNHTDVFYHWFYRVSQCRYRFSIIQNVKRGSGALWGGAIRSCMGACVCVSLSLIIVWRLR